MNENQEVETRKRRTRGEVKRLVAEFEASGIQRNEFCRTHGIALSTLQRHLKRHGSGVGRAKAGNRLVAVELSGEEPKRNSQRACALEVVLPGGRRIEVRREFDTAAMGQELVSGTYIQADETTVGVQMHDNRGKNHQAYLWQYSRPGGLVVFDFRMGREREGPKGFLGNFEGRLQSDGYSVYDHVGGPKIVHAACWAHAIASIHPTTAQRKREFSSAFQLCIIPDCS